MQGRNLQSQLAKTGVCTSLRRLFAPRTGVNECKRDFAPIDTKVRKCKLVSSYRSAAKSEDVKESNVIYLKSVLAGLVAVFSAAILLFLAMAIYFSILVSREHGKGAIGWDPISIVRPGPDGSILGWFSLGV